MVCDQLSVTSLIAHGSNIGDRLSHLQFAANAINANQHIFLMSISSLYETTPVGGPKDQESYYNAAILVRTTLSAKRLLIFLKAIEYNRLRKNLVRWGPRTLDLDLLTYGTQIINEDNLRVPHPRMQYRKFVMAPVCDVAPLQTHPVLDQRMCDIYSKIKTNCNKVIKLGEMWR